MLPRKLRLSRQGFTARGLQRASSRHFSVAYGETSPGGAAVVISKKVAKLSVTRHLLKRRLLAVMRPYITPDRTVMVHVRPGAADVSAPELRSELDALLASLLSKAS